MNKQDKINIDSLVKKSITHFMGFFESKGNKLYFGNNYYYKRIGNQLYLYLIYKNESIEVIHTTKIHELVSNIASISRLKS